MDIIGSIEYPQKMVTESNWLSGHQKIAEAWGGVKGWSRRMSFT
jgi:hypothetical protein